MPLNMHDARQKIQVSLLRSSSDLYIKIMDDGCGFDPMILEYCSRSYGRIWIVEYSESV